MSAIIHAPQFAVWSTRFRRERVKSARSFGSDEMASFFLALEGERDLYQVESFHRTHEEAERYAATLREHLGVCCVVREWFET